jgi:hypothetical protein
MSTGFGRGRKAVPVPAPGTLAGSTALTLTTNKSATTDYEPAFCLVCAEPISLFCIAPCGHNGVCGMCTARLRLLGKDRRCLLCKAEHEHAVVSRAHHGIATDYESFGIYGNLGGPALTLDDASGLFFHSSADADRIELTMLRQFRCGAVSAGSSGPPCGVQCGNLSALSRHLATAHGGGQYLCDLCAANRAVFVMELKR